ncbi:HA1F protein, partial [Cettia cetti]|nr:HA1F protein [Cettia cetti]
LPALPPVALPEPGPGFPRFLAMGSLDGIPFQRRHSQRGRAEPQPPGMAAGAEPGFWDGRAGTRSGTGTGPAGSCRCCRSGTARAGLGLPRLQEVSGCDLLSHGSVRGSNRLGSGGQEFLSFQPGSGGFVVAGSAAQVTKRRWEQGEIQAEGFTNPLGHTCLECLWRCVRYGREALEPK